MNGRLRAWLPLAGVAILLAAVVVAAGTSRPRITNRPVPRPTVAWGDGQQPTWAPPSWETGAAPPEEAGSSLPGWVGTLLGLVCLAAVVVAGLVLAWYLVRDRIQVRPRTVLDDATAVKVRQEEVRAAVQAGIDELVDGRDPRSAVIACWLRLEKAAATAGTPRKPTDTAADLVTRMLATHDISEPVLDRFAEVYRQARYAPHVVDETMRDEAHDALTRLRVELAGTASAGPAAPTAAEKSS